MLTDKAGKTSSSTISAPEINISADDNGAVVTLSGRWTSLSVARVDNQMRKLENGLSGSLQAQNVKVDVGGISGLDTAGAWLIERLRVALSKQQVSVQIENIRPSWTPLLEEVGAAVERYQVPEKPRRPFIAIALLDKLGRLMYAARDDFLMAMHILGAEVVTWMPAFCTLLSRLRRFSNIFARPLPSWPMASLPVMLANGLQDLDAQDAMGYLATMLIRRTPREERT